MEAGEFTSAADAHRSIKCAALDAYGGSVAMVARSVYRKEEREEETAIGFIRAGRRAKPA